MACPRCRSWSVRADRSLGGRMVCGRCGTPLQGIKGSGRAFGPAARRASWRWWLVGLLIAAASLAALDSGSRQPQIPNGSSDRLNDRWQ